MTLGELRVAALNETDAAKRARYLSTLQYARRVRPISVDESVAYHWAALRSAARSLSQSRINDLWIAATALALGVPVITQDSGFVRLAAVGGPRAILV